MLQKIGYLPFCVKSWRIPGSSCQPPTNANRLLAVRERQCGTQWVKRQGTTIGTMCRPSSSTDSSVQSLDLPPSLTTRSWCTDKEFTQVRQRL